MQPLDNINTYVTSICNQIRWKKARPRVEEEMKNHVIDQRDYFMTQGFNEETATEMAIVETGDASMIGMQFDQTHRPKPQWSMLTATAILLTFGFLIQTIISSDSEILLMINSYRWIYTIIGIIIMFAAYFSDFSLFGKYPKTVYFSVILLSVATFYFSPKLNGRSFYSQYIILLFPLAFASIVFEARNKGYIGIILCGLAFGLQAFIAINVSISCLFLFAVAGVTLMSVATYKKWFGVTRQNGFLLIYSPIVLATVIFLLNMSTYKWKRITVALNPWLEPNGAGFRNVMVRELLNGAKLFGMGDVPEQYSFFLSDYRNMFYPDFILTKTIVVCGWITLIIVLCVLVFFIVKGIYLCLKQKSCLGLFISLSIMITFSMQALVYILVNLGFQLLSPISLPLISSGGTSIIINLGLIGFMLSVFRTGDIVSDSRIFFANKKSEILNWNDGTLSICFKKNM